MYCLLGRRRVRDVLYWHLHTKHRIGRSGGNNTLPYDYVSPHGNRTGKKDHAFTAVLKIGSTSSFSQLIQTKFLSATTDRRRRRANRDFMEVTIIAMFADAEMVGWGGWGSGLLELLEKGGVLLLSIFYAVLAQQVHIRTCTCTMYMYMYVCTYVRMYMYIVHVHIVQCYVHYLQTSLRIHKKFMSF